MEKMESLGLLLFRQKSLSDKANLTYFSPPGWILVAYLANFNSLDFKVSIVIVILNSQKL